jgi:hypothetical protein
MNKYTVALALLICTASFSCQTYTQGLPQGVVRADETSVTATLRTIALTQKTFAVTSGGDYGTFKQLAAGDYLDSRFNADSPTMNNYVLTMAVTPKSEGKPEGFFTCNADPTGVGTQGGRHFYIDSTSPGLHVNPSAPATASDPIAEP